MWFLRKLGLQLHTTRRYKPHMARRSITSLDEELARKVGVTLPDGRVYKSNGRGGGRLLSAEDAGRTAATRARTQDLSNQTAGVRDAKANYFLPAAAATAPVAALPAARPALGSFSEEEVFAADQTLRDAQARGVLPGRNYSDAALARATPAQRVAESKLLNSRVSQRASQIALTGSAPGAAAVAPATMADQASEFIPGTRVKAPAGASMYQGADGNLVLQGRDGIINRINPSDAGALSQWAESNAAPAPVSGAPAAGAAPADLSSGLAAIEADASKALAAGGDPRLVDQIRGSRIAALDPTGEQANNLKVQRGLAAAGLAADADLARDNAATKEAVPRIEAAYANAEDQLNGLDRRVEQDTAAQVKEAGAPLIQNAVAAANTLSATNTPAGKQAALQLLAAAESGDPVAVAGAVSGLQTQFPLELGGFAESAGNFAKSVAAIRTLADRQAQQERQSLQAQLFALDKESGFRISEKRRAGTATNGRQTISGVGATPIPLAPSGGADPLAIVEGAAPGAQVRVGAELPPAAAQVPTGYQDLDYAAQDVVASPQLIAFGDDQLAAARAQVPAFYSAGATGELNRAGLRDRLSRLAAPFTQARVNVGGELVDLPENIEARAAQFPEGSAERRALLLQAEVARLKISRAVNPARIPVPQPNRPALSGFAV